MNHHEIKEKGKEVEEYVKTVIAEHLPIARQQHGGDFGIGKHGYVILEIKSAELRNSGGKEREFGHGGRFFADRNAHTILLRGGYTHWYCLCLTYRREVVLMRFIRAKDIVLTGSYIDFSHFYRDCCFGLEKFVDAVKKETGEDATSSQK